MKIILHLIYIYVCVFLTSIPFLFLAGYWIWAKIKDVKIDNNRLKIFVINALVYPFIFSIFFLTIFKFFAMELQKAKAISQVFQDSNAALLGGTKSSSPGGVVGAAALTNLYIAATLGLTQFTAMGYALITTTLTFKPQPKSSLWTSYLSGFVFALALILLIYIGRNSMFEHLRHMKH